MKIHFQQSSILWIIAGLATIANVLMHILRGEEMVFQGNTEIVPLFGFAAGLALIGLAFRPANRKLPPNLLKSTTETWPFAVDSVFYAIKANMPAKNIDHFVFTCTLETEDPVNHRLVYDIEAVEDSDVLFEFKKISGRIAMDISLAVDPGNA